MNQKIKYLLITAGVVTVIGASVALATSVSLRGAGENRSSISLPYQTPLETALLDLSEREDEPASPFEPYGKVTDAKELEWESAAGNMAMPGSYDNSKTVSWEYAAGKTIYVGMALPEAADALYLGLHCSEAAGGNEIGYFLSASTGSLQYSRGYVGPHDDNENEAYTDFVIADRLYSRVRAIGYADAKNYGVRWTDEYRGAEQTGNARLHVRAVNLTNGALVCICEVEIGCDAVSGVYSLQGIQAADVKETGESAAEIRDFLIDQAIIFAERSLEMSFADYTALGLDAETQDWKEASRAGAAVDKGL